MTLNKNYGPYHPKSLRWLARLRSVLRSFPAPHLRANPWSYQSQQDQIEHIQQQLAPLSTVLDQVAIIEEELLGANIEENDYTVFTHSDLDFELKLVQQIVVKKIKFLDNQVRFSPIRLGGKALITARHRMSNKIVARNMTNLTPAQLEQFESTFRYFDRDGNNTLSVPEMTAALASLGIVYSVNSQPCCPLPHSLLTFSQDDDIHAIHEQLVSEYGDVTFEAFTNLLVSNSYRALECNGNYSDLRIRLILQRIKRHRTNYETHSEASPKTRYDAACETGELPRLTFRQPFVTEVDLKAALLPQAAIDYLREAMPRTESGAGGATDAYDYESWLDHVFN